MMKVVILAGGLGTRISEETGLRPKPMVEIGGKPLLWHILKNYSTHGCREFVICLGYKGYVIKEYFANYFLHMSDVTLDLANNKVEVHENSAEPWRITLVDTGESTMTGGRLKRVMKYLDRAPFLMTYGDGVADVNIARLVQFHEGQGKWATVTAVRPPGRFGSLELNEDSVKSFEEKPLGGSGWINGGFFVLTPQAIDLVSGDEDIWERAPMEKLAASGQLAAFRHDGFWHAVDTLRDKNHLEELWARKAAPWKVW